MVKCFGDRRMDSEALDRGDDSPPPPPEFSARIPPECQLVSLQQWREDPQVVQRWLKVTTGQLRLKIIKYCKDIRDGWAPKSPRATPDRFETKAQTSPLRLLRDVRGRGDATGREARASPTPVSEDPFAKPFDWSL
ncbi:unnamed protein product [Lota lota]